MVGYEVGRNTRRNRIQRSAFASRLARSMGQGDITGGTADVNVTGGGSGGTQTAGPGNPVEHASPQPPAAGSWPSSAYLGVDGHVHYQLVSGDYGYGIPPKFGQSAGQVSELEAANPGVNWNNTAAGYDLILPDAWFDQATLIVPTGTTPGSGGDTGGGGGGTTTTTPGPKSGWTTGQKALAWGGGALALGAIGTGIYFAMRKKRRRRRRG